MIFLAGLMTCSFSILALELSSENRVDNAVIALSFDNNSDSFLPSTCIDYKLNTSAADRSTGSFEERLSTSKSHKYYNFDFEFHFQLFYAGFGGLFEIEIENEKQDKSSQFIWSLVLDTVSGSEFIEDAKLKDDFIRLRNRDKDKFEKICGTHFVDQIQKGFKYQIDVKLSGVTKEARKKYRLTYGGAYMRFMLARTYLLENQKDFSSATMEISLRQTGGSLSDNNHDLGTSRLTCHSGEFSNCFKLIDQLMIEGKEKADVYTYRDGAAINYVLKPFSEIIDTESSSSIAFAAMVNIIKNKIDRLLKKSIQSIKKATFSIDKIKEFELRDQGFIKNLLKACIDDPITCNKRVFGSRKIFDFNDLEWGEDDLSIYSNFTQYCQRHESKLDGAYFTLSYIKKRLGFSKETSCKQLGKQLEKINHLNLAYLNSDNENEGVFDLTPFLLLKELRKLDLSGHKNLSFRNIKIGKIELRENREILNNLDLPLGAIKKVVKLEKRVESLELLLDDTPLYTSNVLKELYPFIKHVGQKGEDDLVSIIYSTFGKNWSEDRSPVRVVKLRNSKKSLIVFKKSFQIESEEALFGEVDYRNAPYKLIEEFESSSSVIASDQGVLFLLKNNVVWVPLKDEKVNADEIKSFKLNEFHSHNSKLIDSSENIYLIGGHNSSFTIGNKKILSFNKQKRELRELSISDFPHYAFSAVTLDDTLIVSGGAFLRSNNEIEVSNKLKIYDLKNLKLKNELEMSVKRAGHEMIHYNDNIFILGGVNENRDVVYNIEKLNLRKMLIYKMSQRLPVGRVNAKLHIRNDRLFIFAGESMHSVLSMDENRSEMSYLACSEQPRGQIAGIDKACYFLGQVDVLDLKRAEENIKTQKRHLLFPDGKSDFIEYRNGIYKNGGFFNDDLASRSYGITF